MQTLLDSYIDTVLTTGKRPHSVYLFAKENGMDEADFYAQFGSFQALEAEVLLSALHQTINRLSQDSTYEGYSVREKLLAFYFTLMEELGKKRSYVSWLFEQVQFPHMMPEALKPFKQRFETYAKDLITEGVEKGEILPRPLISDRYADGLCAQLVILLKFWLKDQSKGFEKTDAAIEKSVNLSMDLMGPNTFDTAFDYAKFMFQSR